MCLNFQPHRWKDFHIIEQKINNRLQQLEDALVSELDTIKIMQTKKRHIAWIRNSLSINSYLDLETSIRQLERQVTEELPEETCVVIRFCGSHREAPLYYRKIDSFILDHKLRITGFSKEITMIDYGITNDTSQFVTEIQVPITTDYL